MEALLVQGNCVMQFEQLGFYALASMFMLSGSLGALFPAFFAKANKDVNRLTGTLHPFIERLYTVRVIRSIGVGSILVGILLAAFAMLYL